MTILLIVAFATERSLAQEPIVFPRGKVQVFNSQATITADFPVEIAETLAQQRRGLMFRKKIPDRYGMYFLYEKPQNLSMWMKNTAVFLDIIFIDAQMKVVKVILGAEPYSFEVLDSGQDVLAALEVKAGSARAMQIEKGSLVRLTRQTEDPY